MGGGEHVLAQQPVHAEKEDLRLGGGGDRHMQAVAPHRGQLAQGVAGGQHIHQVAVAVAVDVEQVHTAGQDDPDLGELVAVPRHHGALFILHGVRRHGVDDAQHLFVGQVAEQHICP